MSTLTTRIAAAMEITLKGDADLGRNSFDLEKFADVVLSQGTGNNQADTVFADNRTLAGSATEDLDLAGGSLSDPVGVALTFATVKAILVRAGAGNGGNIVVGGDINDAPLFSDATDKIPVLPGGTFLWVAPSTGITITASTGDILQIENTDAAAATYDIIIIGTS